MKILDFNIQDKINKMEKVINQQVQNIFQDQNKMEKKIKRQCFSVQKELSLTQKFSPIYRKVIINVEKNNKEATVKLKAEELKQISKVQYTKQKTENQLISSLKQQNKKFQNQNHTFSHPSQLYTLEKQKSLSIFNINSQIKLPEAQDRKHISNKFIDRNESLLSQLISQPPSLNIKMKKKINSKIGNIETKIKEEQFKEQVKDHFRRLNLMIEKTGGYFDERMKTHENELLKIMKQQIRKIEEECEKTIKKYNEMLKNKRNGVQYQQAREEIAILRKQVNQVNKINDELKKQIKYLKKLNNEYQLRIKTQAQTLKHIQLKLLTQKQKTKKIKKSLLHQIIFKLQTKPQFQTSNQTQQHLLSSTPKHKDPNSPNNLQINTQNHKQKTQISKVKPFPKLKKSQIQKYMISKKIQTEPIKELSQQRQGLTNMKRINNNLDKIYKATHNLQKYNSLKNRTHSYQSNNTNETNRQRIINFLKQSKPSLKQEKKMVNQESLSLIKVNKKKYSESSFSVSENKIKKIKNLVKMSSFDQQRWQQMKSNSISSSIQQFSFRQNGLQK